MEPSAARRELGLAEDGQYIGTVSSLVAYEGIDDLVAAFAQLAGRYPDLRLLIVGDGVSIPALREQANQSGYGDRIVFTGRVSKDEAVRYHQALDVFVVPRKDFDVTRAVTPLKPVEALRVPGPWWPATCRHCAKSSRTGSQACWYRRGSPQGSLKPFESCCRIRDLAAKFGAAGRQRVLRERTWAANAVALARELEMLGVTIK